MRASLALLGYVCCDGAVEGAEDRPQAVNDVVGAHHGRNALAAMFNRAADGFNVDAKFTEMVCQSRFRQDEQGIDAVQTREFYGAEVETDRDVRKARLLRRARTRMRGARQRRTQSPSPKAVAGRRSR